MIARGAFESAALVSRTVGLDAREHRPGAAVSAERSNDCVRPLRGRLKIHDAHPIKPTIPMRKLRVEMDSIQNNVGTESHDVKSGHCQFQNRPLGVKTGQYRRCGVT